MSSKKNPIPAVDIDSIDDRFDIRHRLLGAIVLVLLGIVLLPLILNGANMAPESVAIGSTSDRKAPREFVSNVRPVGQTGSSVKVESTGRLTTELEFQKPDVVPENGPETDDTNGKSDTSLSTKDLKGDQREAFIPDSSKSGVATTDQSAASNSKGDLDQNFSTDPLVKRPTVTPPTASNDTKSAPEVRLSATNENGELIGGDVGANDRLDDTTPQSPASVEPDDSSSSSVVIPLESGDDKKKDSVAVQTPAKTSTPSERDSSQPESVPRSKPLVNAKPTTENVAVAKADGNWVVRVGTFGKPTNATRMIEVLASSGFKGQSTLEKTRAGKTLTRVWVGPYQERSAATRVLSKIEKATGEKGFITAYP